MLKTVLIPSSFLTGATFFIAGWNTGANMNPIPAFSRQYSTSWSLQFILTPTASSISAPPHLLVMLRLPCLAMVTPQLAAMMAAAVLTLKVFRVSPPVPQVSTSGFFVERTFRLDSRMARTKPVISVTVSPLMDRAVKNEAVCAWVASPFMMSIMDWYASSSVRSSPPTTFTRHFEMVTVIHRKDFS